MRITGVTDKVVSAIRRMSLDHWLNASEFATFTGLDPSAADDWLAGRVALKQACIDIERIGPVVPSALTVTNGPTGVPSIREKRSVFCSISHSDGWGAAGVSHRPIGVDIERIKTRSRQLLRYISSYGELAGVSNNELSDRLVTKVWTMKEAAMKAWGTGLQIHPRCVRLRRTDLRTFTAECMTHRLAVLNIALFELGDFLLATASTETSNAKPTLHWLDTSGVSTA